MKALKLRTLILTLMLSFSLTVVAAGQTQSENDDPQDSNASKPEQTESNDQGGDRGFDPCLLNPSLAVCADKQ
jgi:hypothetical protein